ncbi:mercury resistance system periplasmic binding protein MerP [Ideonella oryzae]|uniref:Periplasmic mercury ion-binding protein n=1 Tax=Ideonella oryzae TaxID=2937441 RepID=A0ABT1BNL9_9BURK|nr:mercury resistance system periplasmic binding protein MerP [Ideonella oryzae]MCO5977022.1 mercury resistance system periplasmic binding protein MerP [Ideonella oryzae]
MKPLLTLTGALAALALATPGWAAQRQVTLNVPTMDCATCPITIRVALMKVPGVSKAVVSYNKRTAKVSYDDTQTDVAALMHATEGVGYPSFKADEQ